MLSFEFITEKTIFTPDVSWVNDLLLSIDWAEAYSDPYLLADLLTTAFSEHDIEFQVTSKANYGSGVYTGRQAKQTGIPLAEYVGGDPLLIIYITKKTASYPEVTDDIINRISQLIKHELIHAEQDRVSQGKLRGSSTGTEDDYYSDPQEINAIASEIESQLLQIESDIPTLISMIKRGDKKLDQSDRYRLYKHSAKDDPAFIKTFNRMRRAVIDRLTNSDLTESFDSNVSGQVLKATDENFNTQAVIGKRRIKFMSELINSDRGIWQIIFIELGKGGSASFEKTGSGNQMEVFTFVIESIKELIKRYSPNKIIFSATKSDKNRSELYSRMLRRITIPGYKGYVDSESNSDINFRIEKI